MLYQLIPGDLSLPIILQAPWIFVQPEPLGPQDDSDSVADDNEGVEGVDGA